MSYGDDVEQLTYLLFLKMADERSRAPYNLPPLDVIAEEIVDDLETALEQFRLIASDLGTDQTEPA